MTNNSLPFGYEKLKAEKPYIRISKLPDGEHRFRIVQRPIAGWIDWANNKPLRFRPENKPVAPQDPTKKVKSFWVLHVWDYAQDGLFIMEITQVGIIKALESYALNEDWGDLTTYDFKIKKEGSGMDTEYTVIPVPHKAMSAKINAALEGTKIRLEALYEGKDPWTDLDEVDELRSGLSLTDEQEAKLDAMLLLVKAKDIDKIVTSLGIETIYDIPPKEFERTMKYFETLLKSRQEKDNESESVA
jgi:hypothetical protein